METTLSWTGTMCLVTSHVLPAQVDSDTGARHAAGET